MTPEIFKCARCGKKTKRSPGATSQKYCKACATNDYEWRKKEKEKPLEEEFTPPDSRCESCAYWQPLNGWKNNRCCHYLLYTGEPRERGEGECLSYSEEANHVRGVFDYDYL